ncbi:MAG: alpha/beta fold hydrolase [Anaerolineaceae bacterium]|nr:alpha/beta fold hydrolase [Anaerolineaceae bacterium]
MPDEMTRQTGFAEVNGARLYYEVAGDGHPLIMLHAGIADSRMWDDQFAVFARHFRAIRYDMRSFGQSPLTHVPYTHHNDLYGLMQFLGIEQAAIMGCSKGGMAALDFTLEHPEMVSRLVLVASSVSGYEFTGTLPKQWREIVAAIKARDFELASELEVQVWVDGPMRGPGAVDPVIRDKVKAMNLIALRNEADETVRERPIVPTAMERLDAVQAPVLVVTGDLDNPNTIMAGEALVNSVPNCRKVVISGTAHLPNMEKPAIFNQTVLDFLQGSGSAS